MCFRSQSNIVGFRDTNFVVTLLISFATDFKSNLFYTSQDIVAFAPNPDVTFLQQILAPSVNMFVL